MERPVGIIYKPAKSNEDKHAFYCVPASARWPQCQHILSPKLMMMIYFLMGVWLVKIKLQQQGSHSSWNSLACFPVVENKSKMFPSLCSVSNSWLHLWLPSVTTYLLHFTAYIFILCELQTYPTWHMQMYSAMKSFYPVLVHSRTKVIVITIPLTAAKKTFRALL